MDLEAGTPKLEARRVAPSRWVFAPLALFPLAAFSLLRSGPGLAFALFVVSSLLASLAFWALQSRYPDRAHGTLVVERKRLLWNGRPVFGGSRVRDAVAFTNDDRHGVRVRTRWRTAYFEVDSREEADRIVEALGLDSRQSAAGFTGQVGIASGSFWLLYNLLHSLTSHGWLQLFALATVVLMVLAMLFGRARWVVGNDGLLVRRGIRRPRFVPYSEIESVEVSGPRLTARLRDQKTLVLASLNDAHKGSRPIVGANALAARIEQARARAGSLEPTGGLASLLARGGRDVGTWLRALVQLDDPGAPFRGNAVPRDRLWGAVEDPSEPIEIRAAAAGALRVHLRDEERVRLRVAATACASPRLRVALEAAEGKDDAAFAEALDAVAEEGAEDGTRRGVRR
jgi:membrane protein YdbS with pleckstrin-like domain